MDKKQQSVFESMAREQACMKAIAEWAPNTFRVMLFDWVQSRNDVTLKQVDSVLVIAHDAHAMVLAAIGKK